MVKLSMPVIITSQWHVLCSGSQMTEVTTVCPSLPLRSTDMIQHVSLLCYVRISINTNLSMWRGSPPVSVSRACPAASQSPRRWCSTEPGKPAPPAANRLLRNLSDSPAAWSHTHHMTGGSRTHMTSRFVGISSTSLGSVCACLCNEKTNTQKFKLISLGELRSSCYYREKFISENLF